MRQYKSRLSEIEERRSIRSALIFGGLTIIIIILAVIFGLSYLPKFVNLFNKNSSSNSNTQTSTLLPPNLSILPQYTNNQNLTVKGTTSPNSTIKIFFNNSIDQTVSDGSGNFAANITLVKGSNTIYAVLVDNQGNISANSNSFTVNYTNQVPNLTVSVPQNNQTFYGPTQKTLTIQGSTDSGNVVTINDHIVILDSNGKFAYSFDLQNGDNQLKIVSTDPANNKKEIDLKVTFNP